MATIPELSAPPAPLPLTETVRHLAYAEAAVMLLESLMLTLIEHRILSPGQTAKVVEDAIATKRQMVEDGEHPQIAAVAAGVLRNMANSLAASRAADAD